ncbi:MAG TPA: hypothetical protein VJ255_21465, partial [Candidatus Acidoferrum sp.]|nr:hypothetical protein [Candidatus Acidoferrum sp.]
GVFFRLLCRCDVGQRPDQLEVTRVIPRRVSGHTDVLDGTVGQVQPMLKIKALAVTECSVDLPLHQIVVLAMNSREDKIAARSAVVGLVAEINSGDRRMYSNSMTVSQLSDHFEQRELGRDNTWRSYATKKSYHTYLKRWIVPHWGEIWAFADQNGGSRVLASSFTVDQEQLREAPKFDVCSLQSRLQI